MTQAFRIFRFFLAATMFAVFASPINAASPNPAPEKIFSLKVPTTVGSGTVTATITNETPSGNSTINSIIIKHPAGVKLSGPFSSVGTATSIALDADGNLRIKGFTGLRPLDNNGTHSIAITFSVSACAASTSVVWDATAYTGNSWSGDTFRLLPDDNASPTPGPSQLDMSGFTACTMSFTVQPGQPPGTYLSGGLLASPTNPVTVHGEPATVFNGKSVTLGFALTPVGTPTFASGTNGTTFDASGNAYFPGLAVTGPAGDYKLSATSPVVGDAAVSNQFTLVGSDGILTCPSNPVGGATSTFGGTSGTNTTTGSRDENKDLSTCVPIPYDLSFSPDNKTVTIIWDELAQPNAVLETDTLWPFELANTADGLPRPTKYNVGSGTFYAATCLSSIAPAQLGTLGQALDETTGGDESIAISFTTTPSTYPFPIIVASASGVDPERMLVKAVTATPGVYTVARQAGGVAHTSTAKVASTPLPIAQDDGLGNDPPTSLNGPLAGFPVPVCIKQETFTTKSFNEPGCQELQLPNTEPTACFQTRSKLFLIGDLYVSRE